MAPPPEEGLEGRSTWRCGTSCSALWRFSREGEDPGESSTPTLGSVPMMMASTDVVFLLGGIVVELCSLSVEGASCSPGENPSFG